MKKNKIYSGLFITTAYNKKNFPHQVLSDPLKKCWINLFGRHLFRAHPAPTYTPYIIIVLLACFMVYICYLIYENIC